MDKHGNVNQKLNPENQDKREERSAERKVEKPMYRQDPVK
jgi:hypothetical protein